MRTRIFLFFLIVLPILLTSCTPAPSPEMTLKVSPSPLAQCALASVHVRIANPNQHDWLDYELLLYYGPENNSIKELGPHPADNWEGSTGFISELPLSLPAGQVFERDIPWLVGYLDSQDKEYRLQLFLFNSEEKSVAETAIPVEFVNPTVTMAVSPTQLSLNSEATITFQVSNPSAASLACCLWISYRVKENDSIIIKMIPVPLEPGETLHQEITWTVDNIPAVGDNEVEAMLLASDMPSPDLEEVTAMLLGPDKCNNGFEVTSVRVPITFSQP